MKLRNKKTGEIREWFNNTDGILPNSLAELNEEWEDYKEPKGWCITMYGGISRITKDDEILISDLKEIGNYFNDKESAYDAWDKLKAWKRLKDKGFRFESYKPYGTGITFTIAHMDELAEDNQKDLDLLFGGEE